MWIGLLSCEVKVDTHNGVKIEAASGSKIRNGIQLNAKGLKVEQAFLVYEDGSLVAEDNKAKINEPVKMRLIISNWKEENGLVFADASEKITTSEGEVLVNEPNLFASYTDGIKAADAKYIILTAIITKVDKLYDYFLVSFRVWDKKGDGEITGSYKLYL